jgi:hypothetical protein
VTGYLTQLAARSLSLGDTVRPRVAAIFEPTGPADVYPRPADALPLSAEGLSADQVWLSPPPPPPGGPSPAATGRLGARPQRSASRRDVPAASPPTRGLAAEPAVRAPGPQAIDASQPMRPTAPSAASAAPVQAERAVGRRTQAAQPGRRGTRGDSIPSLARPPRAGSHARVTLPGQPPVPVEANPAEPPDGDHAAPAREAAALADSIAIRPRERGAGAALGPGVSADPGPPDADTGHVLAPVTARPRKPRRTESSSADHASQPTTVQVTIGRVEVRAVPAAAPRTRSDGERRPMVTLAEHLQAREARR